MLRMPPPRPTGRRRYASRQAEPALRQPAGGACPAQGAIPVTNPLKLAESALAAPGGRGLVHFFIDRPVFASVLSIIFVLLGGVAAPRLAVEQYPNVVPPLVQVTASYPGASGQLVSDTVATPVEQQVNGADNML